MYIISLKDSNHDWEIQNLVTIFKNGKSYDIMKCKGCGIKGKRITVSTVELKESYSKDKVFNCPKAKPISIKRIKITHCTACGRCFENLIPGSEHDVIDAPAGEKKDNRGVWVMGVGEPVKVLNNEFIEI